jgi:hypothetical protein
MSSLFNKIGEKGRTVSACEGGGGSGQGPGGSGGEMTQTLYAQINKRNKRKCYLSLSLEIE